MLGLAHVNLIFGDSHARPAPDPNVQIKRAHATRRRILHLRSFELESVITSGASRKARAEAGYRSDHAVKKSILRPSSR